MFTLFQHCHHSFKGFAAVAGILSILLLQLAFTVFLKTSDLFVESDRLVKTAEVALYPMGMPATRLLATLPADAPEIYDGPGDQEISIKPRRFRAVTASFKRNPVIGASVERAKRKTPRVQPKVVFSDTIIRIGHTASNRRANTEAEKLELNEQKVADVVQRTNKTKTDKRSFVASVLPIVKKPFGWMKSIGSKLF